MNIVVCIKQTLNTEAHIVLDSSGKIDDKGISLIINPYDEYAIEEGLRLKEKFGGVVTVVSIGGAKAQEAIRSAQAVGVDKGILISDADVENADEWVKAEILAKAISQIPYDLILSGRTAIDDGSSQVAVRLAEALNISSVSSVLKLEVEGSQATVTREIDGGTEVIAVALPVVITAQKGLNNPRYPTVAGIMKAKRKELKNMTLAELDLNADNLAPKMSVQKISLPNVRKIGRKIEGEAAQEAQELARLLREEAKVL
ncbi:electron transfer flavoprotein subunit beta/FixA family protein [Desulfitobacterium sp. AusDCA]|uniref:electron transfer flavoprotein subunit beta/FixA family protein n=1 Tax=Desulfitobacterium sp. AusDCA TaxID=3240383 RepID=UPI003DA6D8C7